MKQPQPPYWFGAKRWGQGWSGPLTWQGWLCMAPLVLGLVLLAAVGSSTIGRVIDLALLGVGLIATIWGSIAHGDPAGRRWRNPR